MFQPKESDAPLSTPPQPGLLLNFSEAARRLGVAVRTLRGWVAANRIRVVRVTQRTVRVEEEELLRFIHEHRDGGPSALRTGA